MASNSVEEIAPSSSLSKVLKSACCMACSPLEPPILLMFIVVFLHR